MTVRPRSQTRPTVQPDGSTTDEMPTIIADLDARVAAAAGIGAAASAATASAATASGPAVSEAAVSEAAVSGAAAIAPAPIDPGASSRAAAITPAPIDPGAASGATTSDVAPDAASLAPVTSGVTGELAEPVDLVPRRAIRTTADHDVIDDGRHTILMATVVAPDEDDEVEITVTQAALEVEDTQDDSGDEPGAAEGEPRPDGPDGGRRRRRRR